jgi:hypothetical protein
MLRISVAIVAVLALMGPPTNAAAQSQKTSAGCYNAATCEAECSRSAVGKNCHKACEHAQATKPAYK